MAKTKEKKKILYLIAPCYNEESVLPVTYKLFVDKLEQLISEKGSAKTAVFCL